ncbi:hypothetical protein PoB_001483900 [Plakobranchus ocellatus]|uniref:Uncharacterized protein n=1 Tax=Plakobranchus ocellatus TaxID=259542 RepID=A0AAV3YZ77_9GAST|nr:hypothetical protein PoB_001483900 [Plakobranchus ocellatus]
MQVNEFWTLKQVQKLTFTHTVDHVRIDRPIWHTQLQRIKKYEWLFTCETGANTRGGPLTRLAGVDDDDNDDDDDASNCDAVAADTDGLGNPDTFRCNDDDVDDDDDDDPVPAFAARILAHNKGISSFHTLRQPKLPLSWFKHATEGSLHILEQVFDFHARGRPVKSPRQASVSLRLARCLASMQEVDGQIPRAGQSAVLCSRSTNNSITRHVSS